MKTLYFYLILCLVSLSGFSQVDTIFFNGSWQKSDIASSTYYRIIKKTDKGFNVSDFDMKNNIQMSGEYKSIEPEIEDGHFIFYNSKGEKTIEGDFVEGRMSNVWKYYDKKGKIIKELDYSKWTHVNTELDFKTLENHFIQNRQIVDDMPTFNNGAIPQFASYISQEFTMPAIPEKLGIKGKVFIQFIIDKDGNMVNVMVQMSKHPHIDCEIKRIIANAPKWRPASHNGEKLDIPVTIPFDLGQ